MRVILINPATQRFSRSATCPLGLLSIASSLKNEGHEVMIYDRTVKHDTLDSVLATFKPNIAGISLLSVKSIADALFCSKELKKCEITVVWGGVFATSVPASILIHPEVSFISLGEGEQTWIELASALERHTPVKDVAGLAWMEDNKVVYSAERPFINLSELPQLDWSLIDVPLYFQQYYGCNKMLYLYAAKGCTGKCSFCYNAAFHKSTYRQRPVSHVIRDIVYLHDNFGMDAVYFADELWCKNAADMHQLCTAIKNSGTGIRWGCQTRVGIFNEEDYLYMKECGCRWIFFGVESGSEEMLRRMKKGINKTAVADTFRYCKRAGIITVASFIIGYPDETFDQMKDTIALAKAIEATQWNFNFFAPIPASSIYNELVTTGRFTDPKDITDISSVTPTTQIFPGLTDIPDKELKTVRAYFMWKSFTCKNFPGMKKNSSFTVKLITDAIKGMFGNDLVFFFVNFFNAAMEFSQVFINVFAHPLIRKKYGLK